MSNLRGQYANFCGLPMESDATLGGSYRKRIEEGRRAAADAWASCLPGEGTGVGAHTARPPSDQ